MACAEALSPREHADSPQEAPGAEPVVSGAEDGGLLPSEVYAGEKPRMVELSVSLPKDVTLLRLDFGVWGPPGDVVASGPIMFAPGADLATRVLQGGLQPGRGYRVRVDGRIAENGSCSSLQRFDVPADPLPLTLALVLTCAFSDELPDLEIRR